MLLSLGLSAQTPHKALEITHLTGDMYVYTTYQTYQNTPFPANGLYVLTDSGAVMLDTPWDSTQFQPLLDSIRLRHGQQVRLCIATHSHEDRTGGLAYYAAQGIPTYTSRQTDSICQERGAKRAEFLFENDTLFRVGQYTFQAYYGGAGHTPDNIVVWIAQEKLLYGGCLIKSTEATGLGNLADADVAAWPQTLKRIRKRFGKARYVIPGHQGWENRKSPEHTMDLLKQ
ncbi:MAG: BlaB/IND/MUS family subclass B1 metallo-beta-lactamase [Bacteroidetes bacterium]|nr:MAG: BlaB/IND/MUS family subclass B1 metallo-beta-lactamase [Bacteroidota bacterium]